MQCFSFFIVNNKRQRYNIIKIILYGSVSRNENTDESDIDIQEKTWKTQKILMM